MHKQYFLVSDNNHFQINSSLKVDHIIAFSYEFQDYCRKNGIKQQFTTAYTPQQNGIAERKSRMILDMTRTMLKENYLPKNFWAKTMARTTYLLNRCPSKSVENMTPQEVWSGYKPSVSHLRIFGCIAYAQVPETKRKKLDDHGEKCIFIGYSEESKAYKLYNPLTNKVVVSRDVIFSEDESWGWNDDIISNEKPLELERQEEDVNYKGSKRPSSTPHHYASSTALHQSEAQGAFLHFQHQSK